MLSSLLFSSKKYDEKSEFIKTPLFQLMIILIGMGASLWTYLLHIQSQTGSPLICDLNDTINCSKIIGSQHGEFLNVPLGIWGLIFWLMAAGLILLPKFSHVSLRYISFWRTVLSGLGFVFALVLMYISYFVLEGICEFCTVVQLCCILYFFNALYLYKKIHSNKLYYATKNDFLKLVGLMGLAFLIPFIILICTQTPLYNYFKSAHPSVTQENSIPSPVLPLLDNENIDYSQGSDEAPIKIVEFTDFECPYCQLLHEKLKELKPLIAEGKVKIYFRNWPLDYHKYSAKLAIAARCAGAQERFWEFVDWAFENARTHAQNPEQKSEIFSDSGIEKKALQLSLNLTDFKACLIDPAQVKKLNKDSQDAQYLGGSGTPLLFINGSQYQGNWLNKDQMKNDILEMLNP